MKYIANKAAKNINSLDSQTIVPTATIFGRFNLAGVVTALLIEAIIPEKRRYPSPTGLYYQPATVKRITGISPKTNSLQGLSPPRLGQAMEERQKSLKIAVYSDDSSVRATVITSLGKQISPDLGEHKIFEFATASALRAEVDGGKGFDLFILDGEAVPEGGLGVAKQLKDEVFNCGVVIVVVGRSSDAWLAGWSRAEGVLIHPLDPFTLAKSVAEILRKSSIAS